MDTTTPTKKFTIVAPQGNKVAYREVVCGKKRVLAIYTGEYLQRLGNVREHRVCPVLPNGELGEELFCDFGGVIHSILRLLNGGAVDKNEAYRLGDGLMSYIKELRSEA